ncbi:hypothetical protein PROFUN_15132 [Planoprotostelium fungivorum]|uniref:Uncharacterized protein n=1 Tax=Planoprotostelium fungivorum TaxID=1890364 RepID=A0A2P6MXM3_9EUKA|nr:hypothetical protein PROFUN_15132 [Planoprotostelium fungivorum]
MSTSPAFVCSTFESLQSQLNSIIETFACNVNARKIAHMSSSQRNKTFNSVLRHYSPKDTNKGRSSAYTSCVDLAIIHFNKGSSAAYKMIAERCQIPLAHQFVDRLARMTGYHATYKSSEKRKRQRAELKGQKTSQKKRKVMGPSYSTGMGIVEGFRESQRLRRPTTRIVLAHQSSCEAIKRRAVVSSGQARKSPFFFLRFIAGPTGGSQSVGGHSGLDCAKLGMTPVRHARWGQGQTGTPSLHPISSSNPNCLSRGPSLLCPSQWYHRLQPSLDDTQHMRVRIVQTRPLMSKDYSPSRIYNKGLLILLPYSMTWLFPNASSHYIAETRSIYRSVLRRRVSTPLIYGVDVIPNDNNVHGFEASRERLLLAIQRSVTMAHGTEEPPLRLVCRSITVSNVCNEKCLYPAQ